MPRDSDIINRAQEKILFNKLKQHNKWKEKKRFTLFKHEKYSNVQNNIDP